MAIVEKDSSVEFKVDVKDHENAGLEGFVYFKINIDRSFPNDVYFNLLDVNNEKICSAT